MTEKGQGRVKAISLGRSLQTALKTVLMYSVEHPAAEKPIRETYSALVEIFRQAAVFTLGFHGQRAVLNGTLTDDSAFAQIKQQFAKRGIALVRFQAGISHSDFKRLLTLLSANPQDIEDSGGIEEFVQRNPIPKVQIVSDSEAESSPSVLDQHVSHGKHLEGPVTATFSAPDFHLANRDGRPLTNEDFQRLLTFMLELMARSEGALISPTADSYLDFVEKASPDVRGTELARLPQFLQSLFETPATGVQQLISTRLCGWLKDEQFSISEWHDQTVSCLLLSSAALAAQEEFSAVQDIGAALERQVTADPSRHAKCCGGALSQLVSETAATRLVEMFLERRSDTGLYRTITTLLRWSGTLACEAIMLRIEEEQAAPNRIRLIRLLSQMGAPGIGPARKRLHDPRWFVVRNACRILGDLGDPDLCRQLKSALTHSDARVQQAALTSVIKGPCSGRAEVLAGSLVHLKGQLLELALDEVTLLKSEESVAGLAEYVIRRSDDRQPLLEKAISALAATSCESAALALARISVNEDISIPVRSAAREAHARHPLAVKMPAEDPVAQEIRN